MENRPTWFDRETLIQRLMTENTVDRVEAERRAGHYDELHESLRPAFRSWLTTNSVPPGVAVAGYSLDDVVRIRGNVTYTSAFTWLDGLLKTPRQTERLLHKGGRHPFFPPPPPTRH